MATGREAEHIKKGRVVNRVYSGKIGNFLDIYRLKTDYPSLFYEPEIFNGARLYYGTATVIMFFSGSYFITGVKDDSLLKPVQELLSQYGTYQSTT